VDWKADTLAEMVGENPELQQRLLFRFKVNTAAQLAEIDDCHARDDLRGMGAVAHKLKSAARTVGALHLGALCQSVEQSATDVQAELAFALVPQLHQAFEAIQVHLPEHETALQIQSS
jgi:HPt (histidine-containing phosphotransfer) domain-containing protein